MSEKIENLSQFQTVVGTTSFPFLWKMRRKLLKTVCVIIYVINENSLWVDSDVTFLDKIVTAVGSLVNGPKKPTESLRKEGNDSTLEMTTVSFF